MTDDMKARVVRLLTEAVGCLGTHDHWEKEGSRGKQCDECVRQNDLRSRIKDLLKEFSIE